MKTELTSTHETHHFAKVLLYAAKSAECLHCFLVLATREDDKLFFIFCLEALLSFADGLCKNENVLGMWAGIYVCLMLGCFVGFIVGFVNLGRFILHYLDRFICSCLMCYITFIDRIHEFYGSLRKFYTKIT